MDIRSELEMFPFGYSAGSTMFLLSVSSVKKIKVNAKIETKIVATKDETTMKVTSAPKEKLKYNKNESSNAKLKNQPTIPRKAKAPGMLTMIFMYSLSSFLYLRALTAYKKQSRQGAMYAETLKAFIKSSWRAMKSRHNFIGVSLGMGNVVRLVDKTARMLARRQIAP